MLIERISFATADPNYKYKVTYQKPGFYIRTYPANRICKVIGPLQKDEFLKCFSFFAKKVIKGDNADSTSFSCIESDGKYVFNIAVIG